MFIGVG